MKTISRFLLWALGWKIDGAIPFGEKKAVIVAAPHTSNWDFIIGRLAYFVMGVKVRFLIKNEVFVWPFGRLVKTLGGIPIDRSRSNDMVRQISKLFEENESLFVVITPEGTRSLVTRWKKGFYYIACEAKVPVVLAYLDYKNKQGGIGPVFFPSGEYEKDIEIIRNFYKDKAGRHPEKFVLPS